MLYYNVLGNTVDEARQQAAIQVLTQHFDIPFSMD